MAIILYCRNGHNLSTYDPIYIGSPTHRQVIAMAEQSRRDSHAPRQPFCTECGAPTLDACPHCGSKIARGPMPLHCGQCDKPFPWTEVALSAAHEYADDLDLSPEEKSTLKAVCDDLTVDTPRTGLAMDRFNMFMRKIGPVAADVLKKIIVDVITEAAKKGIGL